MVVVISLTNGLPITATARAPEPLPPSSVIIAVVRYPTPESTTSMAITAPALLTRAVITAGDSAVPVTITVGGSVYPEPPSTTVTDSMLRR